jgi:hypothetical protein
VLPLKRGSMPFSGGLGHSRGEAGDNKILSGPPPGGLRATQNLGWRPKKLNENPGYSRSMAMVRIRVGAGPRRRFDKLRETVFARTGQRLTDSELFKAILDAGEEDVLREARAEARHRRG